MSIISEALKKANAERHQPAVTQSAGGPSGASGRSATRSVFSTLLVLSVLILPFAIPRLLNRTSPASDGPASVSATHASPAALPMADAPAIDASSGLAQIAIETQAIPQQPPAQAVFRSPKTHRLQGIVWTENKGYYAILDNEVIREGSLVGEMRVTHITPAGIVLANGSETQFIEKTY